MSLSRYIIVHKPIGLTPLQTINQYKKEHPKYKNVKIGYAGRLDPMAHGKLLLLVGDENKKKHIYEKLDKTYRFSILFGISTDSYDLLGMAVKYTLCKTVNPKELQYILASLLGPISLPYPPLSSYRINGKALYYWARNQKLSDLQIPKKNSTIYSLKLLKIKTITVEKLNKYIDNTIPKILGNFRQKKILKKWNKIRTQLPREIRFNLAICEAKVSSGTYIRAIVHEIGKRMNIPTLTYSIKRISIEIKKTYEN